MKTHREQYQEETGRLALDRSPRYAGDRFGPESFTDEYVEWLERKLTEKASTTDQTASRMINERGVMLYTLMRILKRKDLTRDEQKKIDASEAYLQRNFNVADVLR